MPADFIVAIVAVFVSVGLATAALVNVALSRSAPERRRLREMSVNPSSGLVMNAPTLVDSMGPMTTRLASVVPKSPSNLSQLRRRLTSAGYRTMSPAIWFVAAQAALPVFFGVTAFLVFGLARGYWLAVVLAVIVGFLLPEFWIDRAVKRRQKAIRNGLPDALDLLIVCLEAGSSLDGAILKASEELGVTHPALADELKLITTEIRAGKPRMEAIKNFADRTRVADVRSLVAMLIQTDKFGTSISQALRTHAETSRTKRRQRAEERAAKVGVKLVFPLVFFLFPALYVVILGPAVIRFVRVFMEQVVQGR
jgi:tight adherence protein C